MKREPTLDTLLALAKADDAWYGATDGEPNPRWVEESKAHFRALKAYRTETGAQLRTPKEVDGEIAALVRKHAPDFRRGPDFEVLQRLCAEPTEPPYGPTGAAAEESREDIAAPGGATIELDGARIALPRPVRPGDQQNDQPSNGRAPGGAEARTPSEPAPGPATALEESEPARGGSHPDDRPCGCEETEALKAQLAALRARNFDLFNQLARIRSLARSHDVAALFDQIDREP